MSLFVGVKAERPLNVGYEPFIEPIEHDLDLGRQFRFEGVVRERGGRRW
jgi:hypothetical protein